MSACVCETGFLLASFGFFTKVEFHAHKHTSKYALERTRLITFCLTLSLSLPDKFTNRGETERNSRVLHAHTPLSFLATCTRYKTACRGVLGAQVRVNEGLTRR